MSAELLRVEGLEVRFKTRDGGAIRAVDGVDLVQAERQTIGVVGESGCGKSTLARAILRLLAPSAGRVLFRGRDLSTLSPARLRAVRRDIQLVFQDPLASLDPRWTVGRTLEEPFVIHGVGTPAERQQRVAELLRIVGLGPEAAERFPHEFSGGQRQRIGIARAIALRPALVILDEPVSALDVSIQAQILNLLEDLKAELGLAYLFISHDLAVVRSVSDRVAVMYLGRIVESGPADAVFERPMHPYTEALLAAIPRPDPERKRPPHVPGEPASPEHPPPGCPFHPRCPHAFDRCRSEAPAPRGVGAGHEVRCHLHPEA
ncbi:MAG: ABC transporter ATP-binding protein [Geminicoccaceae bacterium]